MIKIMMMAMMMNIALSVILVMMIRLSISTRWMIVINKIIMMIALLSLTSTGSFLQEKCSIVFRGDTRDVLILRLTHLALHGPNCSSSLSLSVQVIMINMITSFLHHFQMFSQLIETQCSHITLKVVPTFIQKHVKSGNHEVFRTTQFLVG